MAGDRRLNFERLLEDLHDINQWRNLGIGLGVPESKLDDIQSHHGNDVNECRRKILNRWISANPDGKWGELVDALRKIGEDHAANHIARKYYGEPRNSFSLTKPTLPRPVKPPEPINPMSDLWHVHPSTRNYTLWFILPLLALLMGVLAFDFVRKQRLAR